MFATTLSLSAWLGLGLGLQRLLKGTLYEAALYAACTIIVALTLGIAIGMLQPVYWIVLGAGLSLLLTPYLVSVSVLRSLRRSWQATMFTPYRMPSDADISRYGPLMVVTLCLSLLFAVQMYPDFRFFGWDEFSHWARYTKLIVETSTSQVDNTSVLFPTYPPAANVWHYFVTTPEAYAEWKVVFAQNLLVVAGLAYLSAFRDRIQGWVSVAVFALGLCILSALGTDPFEIYTDGLLGLFFGIGLLEAAHASEVHEARARMLRTAFVCMILLLMKPTGVLFALSVLGVFAMSTYIDFRPSSVGDIGETTAFRRFTTTARQALGTAVLACIPLLIWLIHVSIHDTGGTGYNEGGLTLSGITEFLFTRSTSETQAMWTSLADRFSAMPSNPMARETLFYDSTLLEQSGSNHGYARWVWAGLITLLAVTVLTSRRRARSLLLAAAIMSMLVAYTVTILLFVRLYFVSPDIGSLPSFERYMSSFYMGIALFATAEIAANLHAQRFFAESRPVIRILKSGAAGIIVALAIIVMPNSLTRGLLLDPTYRAVPQVDTWINEFEELSSLRSQTGALAATARALAGADSRVYVVAQNETGYSFYMAGHELSPLPTNRRCFSLGESYREGDIWTCDTSLEEQIDGYDFLLLRYGDEQFWRRNGYMFSPAERGMKSALFRILPDKAPNLELVQTYEGDIPHQTQVD